MPGASQSLFPAKKGKWQDLTLSPNGENGGKSPGERHFCRHCASALWVFDPRWPELVHPFASAIDTDLPIPPERVHLLLDSKANWVEVEAGKNDKCFDGYPEESIAEWHRRLGLEMD